jgi:hypothetical protein
MRLPTGVLLQDRWFHLIMKKGMREIAEVVREAWTNPHCAVDRQQLMAAPPVIAITRVAQGLESCPGPPTTRNSDMQHKEWRAAFFRDAADSKSGDLSTRDLVLAALWTVKNYISSQHVRDSWKETHLHPFNPDGHKQWCVCLSWLMPQQTVQVHSLHGYCEPY